MRSLIVGPPTQKHNHKTAQGWRRSQPGAVRVILWVSTFFIVFLLGMLAWPSVAPRIDAMRRKRRGVRRRYFQD
jgi:hypothetical protein